MKTLHKIPSVDENVCTCEQMIAYNICQSYGKLGLSFCLNLISDSKYNQAVSRDLIIRHFAKYRAANYPIFSSYQAVGEMFCL